MKAIKFQQKINYCVVGFCICSIFFTGCKKFLGLPLQQNEEHVVSTIDPRINMTAWDFIKLRGLGSIPADTIFKRMHQGIIYSGIDTTEYTKTGRTFILLHNDAILRRSGTTTTTDSYFGKYRVGNNLAANRWEDYPKEQVKNYLLSLIVQGEHTFENVGPDPKFAKLILPEGTDPLNPASEIAFRVLNDRDSRFRINDFPGSAFPAPNLANPGLNARTAGILATNGPVHVVDRVLFFQRQ